MQPRRGGTSSLPERIDVNINITIRVDGPIALLQLGPARRAVLKIGGSRMPGSIDVDTTDETATVTFVDSHGNETTAPAEVEVTFSSDNESVATAEADAANPLVANIVPVAPGDANISVHIEGDLDAEGNDIPDPDPVALHVDPGKPVGERLSVGPS
jgi:hypothetical protein